MKIGTYYYPEQWPREQWERDFDGIAAMGLQIVHMGEFAWFTMEPRPGEFQFDWLERCVELAAARKLDVILCTPTAAPPVWLVQQHPDVLPLNETNRPKRFGGRRHYSPVSPAMREATARVVTALADRFGKHPGVIGWQIDNEYGGGFDQSPHAHAAFRQWLRRKYETVERLNQAWGCQFWNTYYTDFEQIQFPDGRDALRHYDNPHQRLDASRFWSWAFADFNRLQADIIRKRLSVVSGQSSVVGTRKKGQRTTDHGQLTTGKRTPFITTNFMPFHADCNPADMAEDLTLSSWDSYPVTGWDKGGSTTENYRIADPAAIGFVHDQMASYQGRWALMEVQPGQINWSGVPVLLYPGAVRLWLWTAFAHGAEFVTVYRYRQPLWGVELFHHGLVGTDGVTPSAGGRQFAQVVGEIKRLDLARVPPITEPDDPESTVGLLFDFEQLWSFATLPQSKRWNQAVWLQRWYSAATRLGLKVKILHPARPWPKGLRVMLVPGLQMVDDAVVARMDDFARGGGQLLLTCRTGLMDRNGQLWEGPTAKPILPLLGGGDVEAYDGLPDNSFGVVETSDNKKFQWSAWGDLLYAAPDNKVLAQYADQFYAGAAAVMQNAHGDGTVTYCGVYGEQSLVDFIVERLAKQAKLKTEVLPLRVQVIRRGPYRVALNYQDTSFTAPAPAGAKFLVGARTVEPAGVAVWEE